MAEQLTRPLPCSPVMRQADLHGQSWRASHVGAHFVRCINKATQPRIRRAGRRRNAPQQGAAVGLSVGVIDLSSRLTHYQEVRKDTVI